MSHPTDRSAINQELHARPYVQFRGPAHILHLSYLGGCHAAADADGPQALVSAFGMRATCESERHRIYAADVPGVGHLVLSWACHTSYTTFTLYLYGLKEGLLPTAPFAYDMPGLLPAGWLPARHDRLLVALRLSALPEEETAPATMSRMACVFERHVMKASRVMGGLGTIWSDYRLAEGGFGRQVLMVGNMSRHELGRTVQRLLNIEDYYHMVLLPLPLARAVQLELTDMENRLTEVMTAISRAEGMEDKRFRLAELMALAVDVEHRLAVLNVRLSPAFSYFHLLNSAYRELRESKVAGLLPVSVFVLRRVAPAVQTYTSLLARLQTMSERIARAGDLLRAAIELNINEQNQRLLAGLDDRAKRQLRLQETVEGLSVIAISYYALGLLGYGLKGAKAVGWYVAYDQAIAGALPAVIAAVWLGARLVRRRHGV